MSSSFVGYRKRGFWASDSIIEEWLYVAVETIDTQSLRELWAQELRDKWKATALSGVKCLGLDEWLINTERERYLLQVVERMLIVLYSSPHVLSTNKRYENVQDQLFVKCHLVKMCRWLRKLLQHELPFTPGRSEFCSAAIPTCPVCGRALLQKSSKCAHCQNNKEWIQRTRNI